MGIYLADESLEVIKKKTIRNKDKLHTIHIVSMEYIDYLKRVFLLLSNNSIVAWDLPDLKI